MGDEVNISTITVVCYANENNIDRRFFASKGVLRLEMDTSPFNLSYSVATSTTGTVLLCSVCITFQKIFVKFVGVLKVGSIYIANVAELFENIGHFYIFDFYRVFILFFNVTHCDYVLIFSPCVLWLVLSLCSLMTGALNIISVLDNFCQIAPLYSNAVWMRRVLHLICKAHTHTHTHTH